MYADDGLIFSTKEKWIHLVKKELTKIVEINETKSSFVKFCGKFVKPLKFCGLIYHDLEGSLQSSTRSGKTLSFSPSMQFLSFLSLNFRFNYSTKFFENDISVKEFLIKSIDDFKNLSPLSRLKWFFNPSLGGYFLNCLYLGSFSFQVQEKDYFFSGLPSSWINSRWTQVYRNIILDNMPEIIKLINFEIEWYCLNLISRKFNLDIRSFAMEDILSCDLSNYLREKFPWELPLSVNEAVESPFINSYAKKIIVKIIELHNLRNEIESSTISGKELSYSLKRQINIFVSSCFLLTKFNCSSYAISDLRDLISIKSSSEKQILIRYSFPNLKGNCLIKNKNTLILKESRKLYRERFSLYPTQVEQGLVI